MMLADGIPLHDEMFDMRLSLLLTALAGLLSLAGCGSAETPSAPPPITASPPPVDTARSTPASGATPAAVASKPQATPKAESPKKALPPGTKLVGGSAPNFQIVPREERPELLAMVISPDPGVNSTLLTVAREPALSPTSAATLPAGFSALADAKYDSSGLPTRIRCDKDGAIMALVPGGIAIQGAEGTSTASPRHPIDIDSFYIDVHEVSVEKFQRFRESTKSDKSPPPAPSNASYPLQPAVGVNWRDATLYAKWTGRELPTESEWEKAARGVNGFSYPWGEGRPIWERRREPGHLSDVGTYRTDESVFGVFDLAGNAREWCQDFFAEDAYKQAPAPGSAAARNWTGPRTDKAARRVVKGSAHGWELWAREGFAMAERSPHIGFRCVMRPTSTPAPKSVVSEKKTQATTQPPATPPAAAPQPKSAF